MEDEGGEAASRGRHGNAPKSTQGGGRMKLN